MSRRLKKENSMKVARGTVLVVGLAFSAIAGAVDFDGSVPLKCTGLAGHDCDPAKAQCGKLKPETKITPEITIDFGAKTIKTPYRTTLLPIENSKLTDEQLQLQGNDKFPWSAVVNRKTGKLTITIADRVGAYVIFGQCKAANGT
jgi:hypothetical protein